MMLTRTAASHVIALGFAALLCVAPTSLHAQAGSSAVTGTIADETGAALPGVIVTVKHDESGISRSLATGPDGRYRATALRPGPYTVVAELAGFSNATRSGVTLTVGSTATVNLTMTVAGRAESITVTGSAPLIDTRHTPMPWPV